MAQYCLLIDGDVLEYEASFAAQKNHYIYDGKTYECHADFKTFCDLNELDYKQLQADGLVQKQLIVLPRSTALMIARNKLSQVLEQFGGGCTYKLILSGEDNFRRAIAKTKEYKGNRKDVEKPVHFAAVQELYRNYDMARITADEEADDMIGYLNNGETTVVCSIDKDLNQLPGLHYDWNKGIKYRVSESDAHLYFMAQVIAGDSTDNVPGIPGQGMGKALKLLRGFESNEHALRWHAVKNAYANHEFSPEYLQEQASLVWVRRAPKEIWTTTMYEETYVN